MSIINRNPNDPLPVVLSDVSGTVTTGTCTTGAILTIYTVIAPTKLNSVTVHLNAAPTSAGSLTITLDAVAGAVYDTLLYTLSMIGVTDLVYEPGTPLYLAAGDKISVAYANTDNKTYGVRIVTGSL
jgi:hypothetical protein